jgi:Putative peptidoglycan binding domain
LRLALSTLIGDDYSVPASGLRGHYLRSVDSWMTRFPVLLCSALLAATLSSAQDSQTESKPANPQSSNQSASHTSTSAHPKSSSKSKSTSTHSTSKGKKSKKSTASHRTHGQQKIDSQRTLQIQEALIREHYLDGKPTGVWNEATEQAMQRYQADNNWQSKTTPDARALIKLGLGPDHEHLLNPESAMTSQPQTPTSASSPAHPDPDKQER